MLIMNEVKKHHDSGGVARDQRLPSLKAEMILRRVQGVLATGARWQRTMSTHAKATVDLSCDIFQPAEQCNAPLILIHGRYGSKTNWRSLADSFCRTLGASVYALDMRNHGTSPHAQPMDYATLANDVLHFCQRRGLHGVSLLGHSMAAMALALRTDLPPGLIGKLIVEDTAPQISKTVSREFIGYAAAMRALAAAAPTTRKEADALLAPAAPDPAVRAFLLTNLVAHRGEPLRWRIPPFLIEEPALEEIGRFPYAEDAGVSYAGDALFIKGARSPYLTDERIKLVQRFFPNARFETLDTGHWVHAERPNEFVSMVSEFIQS